MSAFADKEGPFLVREGGHMYSLARGFSRQGRRTLTESTFDNYRLKPNAQRSPRVHNGLRAAIGQLDLEVTCLQHSGV